MTDEPIKALIINGRHGGTRLDIAYCPTIKLPITDKSQISIGEHEDGSVRLDDMIEYHEAFRSIDGRMVLYSTNGASSDIQINFDRTYPIRFY